jgi:hypothetical protein
VRDELNLEAHLLHSSQSQCSVLWGRLLSSSCVLLQLSIGMDLARTQGVGALYKGLSAGLLRQATYTTARLGLYDTIFAAAKKFNDNKVRSCLLVYCGQLIFFLGCGPSDTHTRPEHGTALLVIVS